MTVLDPYAFSTDNLTQSAFDMVERARADDSYYRQRQAEAEKVEARRQRLRKIGALASHPPRHRRGSQDSPWARAGFPATDLGRRAWRASRWEQRNPAKADHVSGIDYAMQDPAGKETA